MTIVITYIKKINNKIGKLLIVLFIVFVFLSNHTALSQEKYPFSISGNVVGLDSGTVQFIRIGGEKFSNIELTDRTVKVNNGLFVFAGRLGNPQAFRVILNNGKKNVYTNIFFVAQGNQQFHCCFDSINDKTPIVSNKINKEFVSKYLFQNKAIAHKYEMYIVDAQKSYKEYQGKLPDFEKEKFQRIMREISISTDSLIFDYIKQNSKSYIGLWKLVERFSERGYSELFENAYSYLSKSLQHTFTGKYLFYSLNESKVTGKGRVFPALSLSNTMDRIQKIMVGKEKFTLIDFWYSHCGPCIAEFPDVRDIYNTYKNKSFNIIGISVDREDDKNDWKAAIEKYGLDWEQLWDKDGTNSKKIFVNSYPTNFLLDSNGVIIQKNIKPDQLKKFLEKNL